MMSKLENGKELERRLKLCLELKFGHEDGIREAIEKGEDTYKFEGNECTILEGLVFIKEVQDSIYDIIKELKAENQKILEEIQKQSEGTQKLIKKINEKLNKHQNRQFREPIEIEVDEFDEDELEDLEEVDEELIDFDELEETELEDLEE